MFTHATNHPVPQENFDRRSTRAICFLLRIPIIRAPRIPATATVSTTRTIMNSFSYGSIIDIFCCTSNSITDPRAAFARCFTARCVTSLIHRPDERTSSISMHRLGRYSRRRSSRKSNPAGAIGAGEHLFGMAGRGRTKHRHDGRPLLWTAVASEARHRFSARGQAKRGPAFQNSQPAESRLEAGGPSFDRSRSLQDRTPGHGGCGCGEIRVHYRSLRRGERLIVNMRMNRRCHR